MERYEVPCMAGKITSGRNKEIIYVRVPGSKSITNRALLLASLAGGRSDLKGVLFSNDSRSFLECVEKLGIKAEVNEASQSVAVEGCGGILPKTAELNVGSAGTAARFLTAVLGVSEGSYVLDSSGQMRRRPMAPLLDSLEAVGCEVTYGECPGHFPFSLRSHGFLKNDITVNIDESSQFLSALMIASVLSAKDLTINVTGTHGMAYIDMTRKMMQQFGAECRCTSDSASDGGRIYSISGKEHYTGRTYDIEPDASAAAYFYACSPLLGVSVCVPGIHRDSLQGDIQFADALCRMGCSTADSAEGIIISPPKDGILHGTEINMSSFSDQAITMAVVAAHADSPTTITGIGHIRLQESDRLSAIACEMNRMGIKVIENADSITIFPGTASPAVINTYDDHRIAMGFTLMGLKNPGIIIDNPGCCAKTFENYYTVLEDFLRECTSG